MYLRNYVLENSLRDNKKIIKDSCIFAAGSAVAVAGVFGGVHFGRELIDFYRSYETLTFASRFAVGWEETKVEFSVIPVFFGSKAVIDGGKKLKDEVSYRKILKKN